jgi:DNA-binding MarR family transcriptional regulator
MAYRMLVQDLHERLHARGWTDVRPAYGFVLLATREGPTTATALATLMGTTKQAASKLVSSMTDAGYVRHGTDAHDARSRPVELTARGRKLLVTVEAIYAELDREWAAVIGAAEVERVRRDISSVLRAAHDGGFPPVRPTW